MYHLIICKSLISKDDAVTKSWYHLSLRYIQGVPKKKTGDILRQLQIASGQVINQKDGNFFGDYVCQVWWHLVPSSFGSARKTV